MSALLGQRFGRLVVTARAGSFRSPSGQTQAAWACTCDCGSTTVVRARALRAGQTVSCGCYGDELRAALTKKAVVGYSGAHMRVRSQRGPASTHACVDCSGTGAEWSYDGGDPDERRGPVRGTLLRYSLDVARYVPRCHSCHSCHRRHDAALRASA